ncbi:MAG: Lrp/AsnC family transcriptional regulator [Actinomycetota bacterium]|nr:Lrp/AsnC family transcriptional regulator [Actinomycetota bacterium]
MIDESLTKRQHEILERLELRTPVKRIATDLGVSRNAVYLQIERLRERGVLPRDYTPSGQPPRSASPAPMSGLELGSAVPAPGFANGPQTSMRSELAALRRPATDQPAAGEYARTIEAAAARNDSVALAYELGRLDATEDSELATGLVESALERLGHLPTAN